MLIKKKIYNCKVKYSQRIIFHLTIMLSCIIFKALVNYAVFIIIDELILLCRTVSHYIARCEVVVNFYGDLCFGYSPSIVAVSAVSGDWTDIDF